MVKRLMPLGALAWAVAVPVAFGQAVNDRVELGKLSNGASVSFIRSGAEWGIDIAGGAAPAVTQTKPAEIQIFRGGDNTSDFVAGYQSVQKDGGAIVAKAKLTSDGKAAFDVEDRWMVKDAVLTLNRKVSVATAEDGAGFYSAIRLTTVPTIKWEDSSYLIPGLCYGEPHGSASPASAANYRAKRFTVREDYLSVPLLGISFKDGNWAAVLDAAPHGDTIQADASGSTSPIIDERLLFGALGVRELPAGGLELSFCLPGTTIEIGGGRGGGMGGGMGGRGTGARRGVPGTTPAIGPGAHVPVFPDGLIPVVAPAGAPGGGAARGGMGGAGGGAEPAAVPSVRRRYHPVKAGLSQSYQVAFRFDKSDSFPDMERGAWRWAWDSLKPSTKMVRIDVEVARKALMDHLADRVLNVANRFGIPYQANTLTGRSNSTKILMSFCGKNIEMADQFLLEGERDKTERGQKMRKLGLGIIDNFVKIIPMSPAPGGSGFDIQSGQAITGNTGTMTIRGETEDLPFLMEAYQREKKSGNDHPEWLKWVVNDLDWVMAQQRADGSFPQSWQTGTTTPRESSSAMTMAPVPSLVKLSQVTGEKKYLDSAAKATEYLWTNYGSKCVYCGATGNAGVADKESGMLALEAFLAVYEGTKDPRWLQRAESAAGYTESWIWIWNVPMPIDANDATLHWKRGVPTIGVNGIGSDVAGHVDQYLDWAVPCYAQLYQYTKDPHYLDVARVLMHGTKAMLALPGRTYDMLGPGWQQEHWRMGPGTRGMGAHRDWLPWVSANHIHGILQEYFDPDIFKQLAE
jgi:hypothetical protein